MKSYKCDIKKCIRKTNYPHLRICKVHYNKLINLGWKNPTSYLNAESAKAILENKLTYRMAQQNQELENFTKEYRNEKDM